MIRIIILLFIILILIQDQFTTEKSIIHFNQLRTNNKVKTMLVVTIIQKILINLKQNI